MTATRDAFASRLNGREYLDELTSAEEREARDARLLVVFGASDDLTEFRGILHDEAGASDLYGHKIAPGSKAGTWQILSLDEDRYGRVTVSKKGALIETEWRPETLETSWLIKPSVPFAPFDIMEDGDLYCRGAVIDEADLLPTQRVLGVSRDPYSAQMMFVSFSASLSDDDLRSVHEFLKGWTR